MIVRVLFAGGCITAVKITLLLGPPGSGLQSGFHRSSHRSLSGKRSKRLRCTVICGLLNEEHRFVSTRPFRSPHHTISDAGLLGGTVQSAPGEVSLAHKGGPFSWTNSPNFVARGREGYGLSRRRSRIINRQLSQVRYRLPFISTSPYFSSLAGSIGKRRITCL